MNLTEWVEDIDLGDPNDWPFWFARRRLASVDAITAALLASTWNELLHPRGRDGKWIQKFGWVRWLDTLTNTWKSGYVSDIDGKTGEVTVVGKGGQKSTFMFPGKQLYARPKPKARLSLPSLSGKKDTGAGFKKIGGQGGSNPGGLYRTEVPLKGLSPDLSRGAVRDALQGVDHDGLYITMPMDSTSSAYNPDTDRVIVAVPRVDGTPGKWDVLFRSDGHWWRVPSDDVPLQGPDGKWNDELRVTPDAAFGAPGSDRRKAVLDGEVFAAEISPDMTVDEAVRVVQKRAADEPELGDEFYVKQAKSDVHARNEALANYLYETAGVPVPDVAVGDDGQTVASKIVTADKFDPNNPDHRRAAQDNMVFDAWLANWDAVGLSYDNMKVDDQGNVWRIDAGGALLFRAQGGAKGNMFGDEVGELDSLRNKSLNPTAAKVYGDVTDAQLKEQAARLAAITPDDIRDIVAAHHMEDWVADRLIARRKSIFDKLGLSDMLIPPTVTPPKVEEPPSVYNPIDQTPQPGLPPQGAMKAYQWAVDQVATKKVTLADIDSDRLRNGVFKVDGRLVTVKPDTLKRGDGYVSFRAVDAATGYDIVDPNVTMLDEVEMAVDSTGDLYDVDEPNFGLLSVTLQAQRDLAVAELVDLHKLDSPEAITAPDFGSDLPPSLEAGQRLLTPSLDKHEIIGARVPLYSPLYGGIHEIVDSSNGIVTLRNDKGELSTYDIDTMTEVVDWYVPVGTLEDVWRTHIAKRNTDWEADVPEAGAPQVDEPDDPMPDVPTPKLPDPDPPQVEKAPDPEPVPAWDGPANGYLNPGEPLDFSDSKYADGNPEHLDELRKALVGKPVLSLFAQHFEDDNSGKVGHEHGVFWVQSIDENPSSYNKKQGYMIRLVSASGQVKNVHSNPSIWQNGSYVDKPRIFIPLDIDAQDFKVTLRKDGTLAVGKTEVGSWWEEGWGTYVMKVKPEFSVTGKSLEWRSSKKSKIGKDAPQFIVPGALPQPKPKKGAVSATEAKIKVTAAVVPGEHPLFDGNKPEIGLRVMDMETGTVGTIKEAAIGNWSITLTTDEGNDFVIHRNKAITVGTVEGQAAYVVSHQAILGDGKKAGPGAVVKHEAGAELRLVRTSADGSVLVMGDDGAVAFMTADKLSLISDEQVPLYTPPLADIYVAGLSKKAAKVGPVKFPAPDGSTVKQDVNLVAKRNIYGQKLTADGFAPERNMVLRRNTDDSQWMVVEVGQPTDGTKKDKVLARNVVTGEEKWLMASTFNVDHNAMLTDHNGKLLEKIGQIDGTTFKAPEGSVIFHRKTMEWSYPAAGGPGRQVEVDLYLALTKDGRVVNLANGSQMPYWNFGPTKAYAAGTVKLGVVDSSGNRKITLQVADGKTVGMAVTDIDEDGNKLLAEAAAKAAVASEGTKAPKYTGPSLDNAHELPHPPITSAGAAPPEPTATSGTHLSDAGAVAHLAGANSIVGAIQKTKDKVAAGDKNWTVTYGIADGDHIEDMHVATQVVEVDGKRYIETRFRLNDQVSEKIKTSLTGQSQEFGDWTPQTKKPTDLVVGDKLRVRLGMDGYLKPASSSHDVLPPNATITSAPDLLGVSDKGHNVYRVNITLANGASGVLHLEDRGFDSVTVAEWDPTLARPKKSSAQTSLSGAALNAGWRKEYSDIGYDLDPALGKKSMDDAGVKMVKSGQYKSMGAYGSDGSIFGRDLDGGGTVQLQVAHHQNSLDGRVTVRVPLDDPDAELRIAQAMEMVGVNLEAQKPPSPEALQKMALNKVAMQFGKTYKRHGTSTATLQNAGTVTALIDAAVGDELGRKATMKDITIRVQPDGKTDVLLSEDIAAAIVAKNGATHYIHNTGGEAFLEAAMKGEVSGLLSQVDRMSAGLFYAYYSSLTSDHQNGAGGRVFTRIRTGSTVQSGGPAVIFDPIAIHRQTDYYYRDHDAFGVRDSWNWGFLGVKNDSGAKISQTGGNELMFKGGMAASQWSRIAVSSSSAKTSLVSKLKAAGVTHAPNGMPIDDFVIVDGQPVSGIHDDTPKVGEEIAIDMLGGPL